MIAKRFAFSYNQKRTHFGGKVQWNEGESLKKITLYADGACSGNPGPGGWGAILRYGGHKKELTGGASETTNNRMELTAVIAGLKALREPCEVEVVSDSRYVVDAVEKGWAASWKRNGWKKADKKPAMNIDLWEEMLNLLEIHKVSFRWIKGHAGHPENERCDAMAVGWYKSLQQKSCE